MKRSAQNVSPNSTALRRPSPRVTEEAINQIAQAFGRSFVTVTRSQVMQLLFIVAEQHVHDLISRRVEYCGSFEFEEILRDAQRTAQRLRLNPRARAVPDWDPDLEAAAQKKPLPNRRVIRGVMFEDGRPIGVLNPIESPY